jgi:N-acetylglucosamine-6-phosphate deacetylase
MANKADLGQEIIVDGHHVHYVQLDSDVQAPPEDLGLKMKIDGMTISVAQKK